MCVAGWRVRAQVGLRWKAAAVLLGPGGNLHGGQLSGIQLLQGQVKRERTRVRSDGVLGRRGGRNKKNGRG